MRNLYSASGYFLEKMELKFMWLDSQAERINEEEERKRKETALTSQEGVEGQLQG